MDMRFEDLSGNLTLKEQAYNNIKAQIMNGNLEPGSRLSEMRISEAMNISRGPIREALNMLVKEGFAEMIPRKGAVVTSVTKEKIENIWEVRKLLEPYAAKISMAIVTDQELKDIEDMLRSVMKNPEDFSRYMESDLRVHALFYEYLTNAFLKNMLMMTKEHSLRIRYLAEESETIRKEVILQVTSEHLAVIDAMKQGNDEKVMQTVLDHLINGEKRNMYSVE